MPIPTEPIGSIPRPRELIEGMEAVAAGRIPGRELDALYDEAVCDTIERFEATDSPVITDGEQSGSTAPAALERPAWHPPDLGFHAPHGNGVGWRARAYASIRAARIDESNGERRDRIDFALRSRWLRNLVPKLATTLETWYLLPAPRRKPLVSADGETRRHPP
jgi:hypothetical protein